MIKMIMEKIQALKREVQQLKAVQSSMGLSKANNSYQNSLMTHENHKVVQQPHYISQVNKEKMIGIRKQGDLQNVHVLNSGAMTPIKKLSGNFF